MLELVVTTFVLFSHNLIVKMLKKKKRKKERKNNQFRILEIKESSLRNTDLHRLHIHWPPPAPWIYQAHPTLGPFSRHCSLRYLHISILSSFRSSLMTHLPGEVCLTSSSECQRCPYPYSSTKALYLPSYFIYSLTFLCLAHFILIIHPLFFSPPIAWNQGFFVYFVSYHY